MYGYSDQFTSGVHCSQDLVLDIERNLLAVLIENGGRDLTDALLETDEEKWQIMFFYYNFLLFICNTLFYWPSKKKFIFVTCIILTLF